MGHLSLDKTLSFIKAPRYLTMPAASFDISDHSIKYFEAERAPYGYVPFAYEQSDLPHGIVHEGEVVDVKKLSEHISYFRKKYKKHKFVNIALPEEHAFVFDLFVPEDEARDSDTIRQFIEFKLSEFIPFNPQEAIFDFDINNKSKSGAQVSVVVYSSAVISEYLEAFESAGFIVKSAELETASMERAVVPEQVRNSKKPYVVLDIGTSKVGVSVFVSKAPIFSTTIQYPVKDSFYKIYKQITGAKNADNDDFFEWKYREGLLFADEANLAELKEGFLKELKSVIDYFNSHKQENSPEIGVIFLSGGNAATNALDLLIKTELGIDTFYVNVWQRMFDLDKFVPDIHKRDSFKLATVIGLFLKDLEL